MVVTINLKEDSDERFVQELYKAGFTLEQIVAMVKMVVRFISIDKEFPFYAKE